MRVYHKLLKQFLTVVADEKGPAYTGNEFADDEISLSFADMEAKRGNLSFLNEDQQEVPTPLPVDEEREPLYHVIIGEVNYHVPSKGEKIFLNGEWTSIEIYPEH